MKSEEKAMREISSCINAMGNDLYEVGRLMAYDHPTLQQNFMRIVIGFIREESKKDYFDLRNEGTGNLCKKLIKIIEEDDVYLPFV